MPEHKRLDSIHCLLYAKSSIEIPSQFSGSDKFEFAYFPIFKRSTEVNQDGTYDGLSLKLCKVMNGDVVAVQSSFKSSTFKPIEQPTFRSIPNPTFSFLHY